MAKELTTHQEMQDRNNRNAAQLPDRDTRLARDTKGAEEANLRHVARREEMAKRPTQNLRMVSPLFAGKKTVDTVEGQLSHGEKK